MSSLGVQARPNRDGWLFGRGSDLLIGCGLGYLLLIPILLTASETTGITQWPGILVLVMIFFLNGPHYGATIVRVYESRNDRRKYAVFSVYTTIALLLLLVSSAWNVWVASLLITAYLTWSPWHFSGQNYGLMLMFLRRRGIDVDPTTKRFVYGSFVLSAALAIMAVHAGHENLVFAPQTLHVANTPTVWYLSIPAGLARVLVPTALLAYLLCVGVAIWRLRHAARLRDLAPAFVLVLTQALWFTVPATLLNWDEARAETLIFAAIWISSAHSIQYLWVTSYYARSSEPGSSARKFLLKSFVAGTAVIYWPGILLAPHLLGNIPWDAGLAAAVFSVVNLHHFILDGAIWKLRDGRVARVLLRTADPRLPEPTPAPSSRQPWIRRLVWTVAGLAVAVPLLRPFALTVVKRSTEPERLASAVRILRWTGSETVETQFLIGERMAAAGNRAAAIQHYKRSIDLFPTGRAWAALGIQYRADGQWDLALNAFDSALELNPDFWGAHYRRAESLLATASANGEAEARAKAMASLERALDLSPGFAAAAQMLARLEAESGHTDRATRTLEATLEEADPADAMAIRRQLEGLR